MVKHNCAHLQALVRECVLDDGIAFGSRPLNGLAMFGDDGSQTRSFCYVSDLIDGIYKLLLSDYHLLVNIGNPQEITLLQFAEEI